MFDPQTFAFAEAASPTVSAQERTDSAGWAKAAVALTGSHEESNEAGSGKNTLLYSALGVSSGFRPNSRFERPVDTKQAQTPAPAVEEEDPAAVAYSKGFAAGVAEAQANAAEQARLDAQARERLEIAFAKLDKELAEELRLKLRDTVAALCEAAIAPLALDEEALIRRVERAVSMFTRADDERVLRLSPQDLNLVSEKLVADWNVVTDPTLERGTVSVQSATGGVEDGPAVWRRSIAEALQC